MSRIYNTFEFIGEVSLPKDKDKVHTVNQSQDYELHRINFGVRESKTNSVYVEMFGAIKKDGKGKVFSFGKGTESKKGEKLEIPWSDRLKPEIIDMVADFKKIVVDLTEDADIKNELYKLAYEIRTIEYQDEKSESDMDKLKGLKEEYAAKAVDRHEFVTEYDAINFLSENLGKINNKKFKIKGSFEMNEWKGVYYRKFKVEHMELMPEDARNQLRANMDIFFDKDSMDDRDFEKEKKIYIDGYIQSYDSKTKKDSFYPQQFVINASKVDLTNEVFAKRVQFLKMPFNLKSKFVHHLLWDVAVFRGAEREDIKYEDLTEMQKLSIDVGDKTLEDYNKKGVIGKNKEEFRLISPKLEKDFEGGAVETDLTPEDLIQVTTEDENLEDIKQKIEKKEKVKVEAKKEEVSEDVYADLFS